MKKKFKDLKKGDTVWIIDSGAVVEASVKDTNQTYLYNQLRVYTSYCGFPYSGWPNSKRAGYMFVNEDEAYELLRKIGEKRKDILEKKIDNLVRKFDLLDSIQPPTVFSSTKPPSMKELKPGDSVWYVDKVELKIKKAKVEKIIEEKENIFCNKVLYIYMSSSITFKTYLNSTRSLNALYYTTEEQAWRYMLKWKKSRMKTVGKEMEKLMKELERYEEVW